MFIGYRACRDKLITMKKILVFAGSNSSTSINQILAKYASTLLKENEVTVIELKDFPAPIFSEDLEKSDGHPETLKKLNELFKSHDGFIISLPEYNSSITPVFKNTVDWISRIERPTFKNKPVLLLSTSAGQRGAMTNLANVESLMPRWGGKVTGTYSLPNFNDNMDKVSGKMTNKEEIGKLKELVKNFELSLI